VATRHLLVLDRFISAGAKSAVDLATGQLVLLRTAGPGARSAERGRADAAARVSSLRIPGMATLVDYGPGGGNTWVEAYGPGPADAFAAAARDRAAAARGVTSLLSRAGCTVRAREQGAVPETTPEGLFIPAPWDRVTVADTPATHQAPAAAGGGPAIGTVIERRDELDALMEWLNDDAQAGARIVRVGAPAGSGLRTFFNAVAREARLSGFVPVSSRLCGEAFDWPAGLDGAALGAVLRDRHVVILDEAAERAPSPEGPGIARFLSRLDTAGGRPHAVVCAGSPESVRPGISLGPMRPDQLCRSVLCIGIDESRVATAVNAAVRKSRGWPAAFSILVRTLLGAGAAERPYRYSRSCTAVVREAAVPRDVTAPAPGMREDAMPMIARAGDLARRGRHAAAERLLRRTAGYLHRRGCAAGEARAQLALGRLLMSRGRRPGAREALEQSRRLSDDARDAAGVVRALLHLGSTHIEDADFVAAESVLRTADVCASRAGLGELARAAGLLLARAEFWQGKPAEAWQRVERLIRSGDLPHRAAAAVAERAESGCEETGWGASPIEAFDPPGLSAVAVEIGVRTALARRDAGLAARRLEAAGQARPEHGPECAGTLIALDILIRGAMGDTGEITRATASGIELMHRRHAPLAAQEIRLARLEALIEAGAGAHAAACARRLSGNASHALSGLARLRLDALAARLHRPDATRPDPDGAGDGTIDTDAVLRILRHCHEAQSDADAVAGVCQTVKGALAAGAVSAFALIDGAVRMVANAGHRACRPDLAERAAVTVLAVGPEDSAAGREFAVPIRYGGTAIGALAVRWPPSSADAEIRSRGVAAAAAAAIGPAVAALSSATRANDAGEAALTGLDGPSAAMAELRRQIVRAAAAPYPVLILGESGTGKELIAKAIHAGSARRVRRFCAVNCAALSDDLFESELFGHARGAFTGAAADRPGLFEDADGGTLLLDEVGELTPRAQAKLLRAIQEGEVRRVGENHPRRVDARIVAATNRLLSDDVRAGRFRHDLLYRLDVVRIVVPPLRERPEDIGPLARGFWRDAMRRTGGQAELSPATLAALARYDWPGNVRELQNTLAALAVRVPPRGRVGPARLPAAIVGPAAHGPGEPATLADARRRFEECLVRATLARTGGRRAEAASALGVSRQGLAKLIARLGIGGQDGATPSDHPG
jgi:transcriptional regulator with GAF, ATPase, and Fis domain